MSICEVKWYKEVLFNLFQFFIQISFKILLFQIVLGKKSYYFDIVLFSFIQRSGFTWIDAFIYLNNWLELIVVNFLKQINSLWCFSFNVIYRLAFRCQFACDFPHVWNKFINLICICLIFGKLFSLLFKILIPTFTLIVVMT